MSYRYEKRWNDALGVRRIGAVIALSKQGLPSVFQTVRAVQTAYHTRAARWGLMWGPIHWRAAADQNAIQQLMNEGRMKTKEWAGTKLFGAEPHVARSVYVKAINNSAISRS